MSPLPAMKICIGIHLRRRPASAAADAPLGSWGEIARVCEDTGVDALWVAERADDPAGVPSALPMCAALAAVTERVRLVTAVLSTLVSGNRM